MRTQRRRTKKLTIAFWFHLQGEPGWKCEQCRAASLEKGRRCGFLGYDVPGESIPVWARGGLVLSQCPKPLVSAQSLTLLTAYNWWRRSGFILDPRFRAKCADAFCLIDQLRHSARASHE